MEALLLIVLNSKFCSWKAPFPTPLAQKKREKEKKKPRKIGFLPLTAASAACVQKLVQKNECEFNGYAKNALRHHRNLWINEDGGDLNIAVLPEAMDVSAVYTARARKVEPQRTLLI